MKVNKCGIRRRIDLSWGGDESTKVGKDEGVSETGNTRERKTDPRR